MKMICFALFVMSAMMVTTADAASADAVSEHTASEPTARGIAFSDSIQRLSSYQGFSCHFDQNMSFSDGGGKHYAGDLAIRKPGHFRWQYRQPYDQLYVGDGRVIWHYEPDLMQAERLTDLEAVNPVVMQLLDGHLPLRDIKLMDSHYDSDMDIQRFQVQVKDAPLVWLGFAATGDLVYIERLDILGNRNRMQLSGCSYIAPPVNLFSFTPPEGVDVLDLRSHQ
ncbi:MAG: outer-membrane lipoprotein carrier protein LolA [Mariprofundus sp.]